MGGYRESPVNRPFASAHTKECAALRIAEARKKHTASCLEMLAESQGLLLIGRAETDAVEPLRHVEHPIIDDFKKRLTVMDEEGDVVRAYFEHHLGTLELAVGSVAESRIEESGVMRSEFAAGRFIGNHLSGIIRRHTNPFFRRKDVKLFRFEEQTVLPMPVERFQKSVAA